MRGEPPATDEEVKALAETLTAKMHRLFSVVNNGIPTKVSWFRLFKHMVRTRPRPLGSSALA